MIVALIRRLCCCPLGRHRFTILTRYHHYLVVSCPDCHRWSAYYNVFTSALCHRYARGIT